MKISQVVAIVSIGSLAFAVGCGDDEETTTTTSTTPTTTTTTTSGMGGSGQGGSTTSAGGMGGMGGGASCVDCVTFLVNVATTPPDTLCGYESGDLMNGLTCEAGSSCELLSEVFGCTCDPNTCAAACGDNACAGMAASQACIACTDQNCADEQNACIADGS